MYIYRHILMSCSIYISLCIVYINEERINRYRYLRKDSCWHERHEKYLKDFEVREGRHERFMKDQTGGLE